jgi:hypothetical protein
MARKTTKLTAVNRILSNIGQSPTTTLVGGNPIVEMAELVLDEINTAVQSEGWVYNTEYAYPFKPNTDNEILVPDNVLALDSKQLYNGFLVIRGGKLYDKASHSFEFTETIDLDVVWLFDFEDQPEAFREYVTIRAANVFAGRSVGSAEAVQFGNREEIIARATALEYDTQQGDYNIFQNGNGYTTIPTYNAFQTLNRRSF